MINMDENGILSYEGRKVGRIDMSVPVGVLRDVEGFFENPKEEGEDDEIRADFREEFMKAVHKMAPDYAGLLSVENIQDIFDNLDDSP